MAPCANLLLKLKWYTPFFHEIFLKNLHNDSNLYNWSIDSILRFYSKSADKELLKFKNALNSDKISRNPDLIIMLTVIYGGYDNIKSFELIAELFELAKTTILILL